MDIGNIYQVLNEDDLNEIIEDNQNKLIVVLFSAKWCGPCRKIKPMFIDFSSKNKESFFVFINIDTFSDKKFKFMENVSNIPHFNYYYNNNLVKKIVGGNFDNFKETYFELQTNKDLQKKVNKDEIINNYVKNYENIKESIENIKNETLTTGVYNLYIRTHYNRMKINLDKY